MKPFVEVKPIRLSDERVADIARVSGKPFAMAREIADEILAFPHFRNDTYQVTMRKLSDGMAHLSIKRLDREPIHDWRDLQTIKNMLVGPECEGVELYPAESRLMDTANQYHLWVMTDAKFRFPFGMNERLAIDDSGLDGVKQRPFAESQHRRANDKWTGEK